jgi:hypothetical protein
MLSQEGLATNIMYVGFKSKTLVREYTLLTAETLASPSSSMKLWRLALRSIAEPRPFLASMKSQGLMKGIAPR